MPAPVTNSELTLTSAVIMPRVCLICGDLKSEWSDKEVYDSHELNASNPSACDSFLFLVDPTFVSVEGQIEDL